MDPAHRRPLAREDERTLHDRLLARDEAALLECFDRFAHLLYCAAVTATRDRTTAEDLTYSLFIQLWRSPAAFHPDRAPLALQLLDLLVCHLRDCPEGGLPLVGATGGHGRTGNGHSHPASTGSRCAPDGDRSLVTAASRSPGPSCIPATTGEDHFESTAQEVL